MSKQSGFWSVENRLAEISAGGDPLETPSATVEFERFRPILERAAGRPRNSKGGHPAMDVVLKFRMLVLQSLHGLSLEGGAGHRSSGSMARGTNGWSAIR